METGWRLARRRQAPPATRYGVHLVGGEKRFTIARATEDLGFVPAVGLAEGVRRSVDWYRSTDAIAEQARSG